jgi:two-component system OmpR family response regulator
MAKVLVVEDDLEISELIKDWLTRENYVVETVHNGKDAHELLLNFKYDVIVLDWMLPDLNGVEICRRFRSGRGNTPILMLTGQNSLESKEEGLDSGADDYLLKPFEPKELSARIRALLRRASRSSDNILNVGPVVLNPRTRTVTLASTELDLFPKDFAVLEFLMRHAGEFFDANAIADHVWKAEEGVGPENVRQSIHRIRTALDAHVQPSLIENTRGLGYRIRVMV